MVKKGNKIKISSDRYNKSFERIGKIEKIYNAFILISFKSYKACINRHQVIKPEKIKIQVRSENKWVDLTKEMVFKW